MRPVNPDTDPVGGRSAAARRRGFWAVVITAAVAIAVVAAAIFVTAPRDPAAAPASPAPSSTPAPDIVALAGPLADQELSWSDCEYGAATVLAEGTDVTNVRCATVEVPKDWHDPDPSETWQVRVAHAQNIDTEDPEATTLILHPGGPASGLSFAAETQHKTPEIRETTNYVSFDQRGLGQSSIVSCDFTYVPDATGIAASRAAGETCSKDADLATMTTEFVAYDMDFIRHLLGAETVSYLGYSYGTWLGTWFGTLFSDNIDRIVLDSAIDGSSPTYEKSFTRQHEAIERQFRLHLVPWIARNDARFGLGSDAEAITDRYLAATTGDQDAATAGLVWGSHPLMALGFSKPDYYAIPAEVVSGIIAEAESTSTGDPVERATRIVGGVSSLPEPVRTVALAGVASPPVPAPVAGTEPMTGSISSDTEVLRCTDGQWTSDPAYWRKTTQSIRRDFPIATQIRWVDAEPMCASWPTEVTMPPISDAFPETIVISSELDALTPFEEAADLAEAMPRGTRIVVDNESIHGVFPYGTEEVDEPVLEFLRGGEAPSRSFVADAEPMLGETRVFESWHPLTNDLTH